MNQHDAAQVDAIVETIQGTLGESVLGIHQYGSAVSSGLKPLSDLDLLVVVDRATTSEQRRRLVVEILKCSGRGGTRIAGRPAEVTVVRQASVKPWRTPPEREFQYGEWLRADYEAGAVPSPVPDDDLAPLLSTALSASTALVGPPLDQLIDPIPLDDLVAAMVTGLPSLMGELADDTRNVLLTLARMWFTICTGDIVSKNAAAAWAVQQMPAASGRALEHARAVYVGEAEESLSHTGSAVEEAARFLETAILNASARGGRADDRS